MYLSLIPIVFIRAVCKKPIKIEFSRYGSIVYRLVNKKQRRKGHIIENESGKIFFPLILMRSLDVPIILFDLDLQQNIKLSVYV